MATQVERRTATRAAIVDAAIGLYLADPTAEPSLDAVAEGAGVAKSTILYHFQSRLGLLEHVAERLYRDLSDRLGPLDRYGDAASFLRAYLRVGKEPSMRVLHRVADQLAYANADAGLGPDLVWLGSTLRALGVTERTELIAAAAQMMARKVTFGHLDDRAIDSFVTEAFAPVRREPHRRATVRPHRTKLR